MRTVCREKRKFSLPNSGLQLPLPLLKNMISENWTILSSFELCRCPLSLIYRSPLLKLLRYALGKSRCPIFLFVRQLLWWFARNTTVGLPPPLPSPSVSPGVGRWYQEIAYLRCHDFSRKEDRLLIVLDRGLKVNSTILTLKSPHFERSKLFKWEEVIVAILQRG